MNKLEQLEREAFEDKVKIHNYYLGEETLKGIYIDGNIAINTSVDTSTEKVCVIAEELGHHHTSVGDIIDMTDTGNRKQERQAKLWGYDKLIGLGRLISAYEHGCHDRFELAEYLEVTDEYLHECIECYRDKYGPCVTVGDYYIMFIPNLQVGKII